MIYYDSPNPAPNPRRVRMFAAEKGIDLPTQTVSIVAREQKSPEFLKVNARGQTPALQLDDGTVLTESVAICRYLEAIHPEPSMFGSSPQEIGKIEMWIRRVELVVMEPVGKVWVHTHPFTEGLPIKRFREYGESCIPRVLEGYAMCDAALQGHNWLAGKNFSMADIVLYTTVEFACFIGIEVPDDMLQLRHWHDRVAARPSGAA